MAYSPEAIQAGPRKELGTPEIVMDYENQGMSGPNVRLHFKNLDLTPDQARILFECTNQPTPLSKPPVELKKPSVFDRFRRKA